MLPETSMSSETQLVRRWAATWPQPAALRFRCLPLVSSQPWWSPVKHLATSSSGGVRPQQPLRVTSSQSSLEVLELRGDMLQGLAEKHLASNFLLTGGSSAPLDGWPLELTVTEQEPSAQGLGV